MGLVFSGEDLIKIAEGHMRSTCRKVNNLARCPAQYSLPKRLTRDLDSRLALVASDPRSSPILLNIVTFRIPITHTIYTLITHRNCEQLQTWHEEFANEFFSHNWHSWRKCQESPMLLYSTLLWQISQKLTHPPLDKVEIVSSCLSSSNPWANFFALHCRWLLVQLWVLHTH